VGQSPGGGVFLASSLFFTPEQTLLLTAAYTSLESILRVGRERPSKSSLAPQSLEKFLDPLRHFGCQAVIRRVGQNVRGGGMIAVGSAEFACGSTFFHSFFSLNAL
jgi:hypothetical protein